jgi:hypothetical protein
MIRFEKSIREKAAEFKRFMIAVGVDGKYLPKPQGSIHYVGQTPRRFAVVAMALIVSMIRHGERDLPREQAELLIRTLIDHPVEQAQYLTELRKRK